MRWINWDDPPSNDQSVHFEVLHDERRHSFKEMLVLIRRPSRQGQAGEIRRVSSTIDGRLTARRPTCFGVHGSKGARATDRPGLHIAIKNIHEQHPDRKSTRLNSSHKCATLLPSL